MKWIWISILVCLVGVLAMVGYKVFTAKLDYQAQAQIEIQASPETVFRMVGNLRNWPRWSPFLPANAPAIQIDQTTSPPTMIWSDPRGGQSHLTLDQLDAVSGEIEHTLTSQIFPPMTGRFQFQPNDGATTVTWKVQGRLPDSFFYALAAGNYGEMMSGQLQQSLTRLKTVCEKEDADPAEKDAVTVTENASSTDN